MQLDYTRDILIFAQKCRRVYEKKCIGIMKKYDLRFSDLDILYHISIAGDRNLAKNLVSKGMSKANVSMSVENLKQKSLINLTEDADPILEEVKAVKEEINNIIFQGINEEERATLGKVRARMEKNIQKEFLETL